MNTTREMTSDQPLPGGLKSMRVPVVLPDPKKKRKRRAQRDPHQVERAPKPKAVRSVHWKDNGLEFICGLDIMHHSSPEEYIAFITSLVPTKDPHDRAHLHRKKIDKDAPDHLQETWVYLDHREVDHPLGKNGRRTGKPRKTKIRLYPRSALTSSGYAIDSMYDAVHTRALVFQSIGVNLGWVVQSNRDAPRNEHDRALVLAGLDRDQAKALLEPRHDQRQSFEERKLDRMGSRMLSRAGLNEHGFDEREQETSDEF